MLPGVLSLGSHRLGRFVDFFGKAWYKVEGFLFAGPSCVLLLSQALVSAACLAGAFHNVMQGEFGIHDGVCASVALLDWSVGVTSWSLWPESA